MRIARWSRTVRVGGRFRTRSPRTCPTPDAITPWTGPIIAVAPTAQLVWTVAEQLHYLCRHLHLGPGDVVLTRSPGTVASVKPGDQAVVAIDGIGELSIQVAARMNSVCSDDQRRSRPTETAQPPVVTSSGEG